MSDFYKSDSKLWSGLQLLQNGSSANGSFLSWKFPRLFYIQGSVIGIFQIWRSTRLLFTTEERHWPPPYRGGDILGLSTREGPEVALHLPKCLKPLIPRTPEATSRPTSAPSFARSTVPVQVKGGWLLQDQQVWDCNKIRGRFYLWNRLELYAQQTRWKRERIVTLLTVGTILLPRCHYKWRGRRSMELMLTM